MQRLRILSAICLSQLVASPLFAQRPDGVPESAKSFGGHWYTAQVGEPIAWGDAGAACERIGGYLAVINSPIERVFVESLLADHAEARFWLGGRRSSSGDWRWSQSGKESPLDEASVALVKRGEDELAIALRDVAHERDLAALAFKPTDLPVVGYVCEWGETQVFSEAGSEENTKPPTGEARPIADGTASLRTVLFVKNDDDDARCAVASLEAKAEAGASGSGLTLKLDVRKMNPDLQNALNEIHALMKLTHGAGISGKITITPTPSDGGFKLDPGSALAWALLCDALIRGDTLDPQAILIGDINADGGVQSDFRLFDRLSALEETSDANVGVPEADSDVFRDLVIRGEFAAIASNSVVALTKLADARKFAAGGADAHPKATEFAMIKTLHSTRADSFGDLLANSKVLAKLEEIVAAQPSHLSSELLRDRGKGALGKTLSLTGSLNWMDEIAAPIYAARDTDRFPMALFGDTAPYVTCVSEIRHARGQLDPQCHALGDLLIDFGTQLINWVEKRPTSTTGRSAAISKMLESEKAHARANAQLRTQLLRELDK